MSSLSDVDICNLALDAAGARSTISSLQERSDEARACSRQYGPALSNMLQAAFWNFARKQASLTLLKNGAKSPPDAVPVPWLYEYAYPSDCIQGRYIMPALPSTVPNLVGTPAAPFGGTQPPRWLVSSDSDANGNPAKVILTNQQQAIFVYTVLITDTSQFDDQFANALVFYLAHRICTPLSGDKSLAKTNYELATRMCIEAQASNGNEGITVIDNVPDWIRVRGYLSDWASQPGAFGILAPQALVLVT